MVDIDIPYNRRLRISREYHLRLIEWIDNQHLWTCLGKAAANRMMQFIREKNREFFLASPKKLRDNSDIFTNQFSEEIEVYDAASRDSKSETSYGLFIKRMRDIYKGFMQAEDNSHTKNGYWLMKKLGVKVCPYCNRNYTVTIDTDEIRVRPEYDHFYPEATYPSLILSFYNLIPSCPACNSLKRTKELKVNPWIGYKNNERPRFRVDTSTGEFPAKPKIIIDNEDANTKKLGIKELYNEHVDYVKDVLDKIQAYNPATYRAIAHDFQGIVHTEANLDRMIWGNYIKESDVGKRPFAKLTADILEQYKKYL